MKNTLELFPENRGTQNKSAGKRHRKLKNTPVALPDTKYKTIVIDPPWPMTKIKRHLRPNQHGFDYPTMDVSAISAMNIPLDTDGFVFVWTTQKYLPVTFSIIEAWHLKYRFTMTWHKPGGIQVFNYPQFNSEFVVCATAGNPKFVSTKAFNTAFHAKRRGHSVKPEEFYEVLRNTTPAPRLDMFNRRIISGFDAWGDQAPESITLLTK